MLLSDNVPVRPHGYMSLANGRANLEEKAENGKPGAPLRLVLCQGWHSIQELPHRGVLKDQSPRKLTGYTRPGISMTEERLSLLVKPHRDRRVAVYHILDAVPGDIIVEAFELQDGKGGQSAPRSNQAVLRNGQIRYLLTEHGQPSEGMFAL